jgi:hypothetical protein
MIEKIVILSGDVYQVQEKMFNEINQCKKSRGNFPLNGSFAANVVHTYDLGNIIVLAKLITVQ